MGFRNPRSSGKTCVTLAFDTNFVVFACSRRVNLQEAAHEPRTPPNKRRRTLRGELRNRASRRWSALTARVRSKVTAFMSAAEWETISQNAELKYKEAFLSLFGSDRLVCSGTIENAPCPHAYTVDLTNWACLEGLRHMHVDHGYEVAHICDVWVNVMKRREAMVDTEVVNHLLYDVSPEGNRALASRGVPERLARCNLALRCAGCHDLALAHYDRVLTKADLEAPKQ